MGLRPSRNQNVQLPGDQVHHGLLLRSVQRALAQGACPTSCGDEIAAMRAKAEVTCGILVFVKSSS